MMEPFPVGTVVERADRRPFPDDRKWAIVRKAEKVLPSGYPAVWLEGLQWAPTHEVVAVSANRVAEAAVAASKAPTPPSLQDLQRANQAERLENAQKLAARMRKKAVKANLEIETWKARAFAAEKRLWQTTWQREVKTLHDYRLGLDAKKLELIRKVLADDVLPEDIEF